MKLDFTRHAEKTNIQKALNDEAVETLIQATWKYHTTAYDISHGTRAQADIDAERAVITKYRKWLKEQDDRQVVKAYRPWLRFYSNQLRLAQLAVWTGARKRRIKQENRIEANYQKYAKKKNAEEASIKATREKLKLSLPKPT
jgi:hypothetical protein